MCGYVSFSLVKNLYFYIVMPNVCIAYTDVPKVHWQTIYWGKFTGEETRHSAWAMFRQHDSWIISNIIFEAHHMKVDETRLPIFYSYIFVIEVTFLNYMCGFGR